MTTLTELLGYNPEDPEIKRARTLVREDRRLLRELVLRRKSLSLSQGQLAKRLGLSQPTVAAFERYDSDPKLSTIRRYAHALGVVITHRLDFGLPHTAVILTTTAPIATQAVASNTLRLHAVSSATQTTTVERPTMRQFVRSAALEPIAS
jgi:transcriptional regulator with XRE-family HTH domain